MNKKIFLTISFVASVVIALVYKILVHKWPWAIGMTQVIALTVISAFIHFALYHSEKIKAVLVRFFTEPESPVNIAFFRIVFFSYLFFVPMTREVVWFSGFPKELQFAPMGTGWLLPWMPIDPSLAFAACILFKTACFLAMIGMLTRVSTVLAAVLGFYVIGIPQFYGDVAHNHHLLWFLVIFAASRCADTLSVDAVRSALKRAELNDMSVPAPSQSYALPLRFIWILMGLCYFFPGFWKFWNSGSAWILGDNLRNHMYYDWMGFDGWLPVCRIDQWPWLCRLGGASVIIFETGFLFFILSPRLRYLAAFGGLFFHNMTNLLMKIDFYDLQVCYVSFFKWNRIFPWIGKRLFPQEVMIVLYDGSCSFCRQAVGLMRVFDVFGRISYEDLHGEGSRVVRESLRLSNDALMKDMHAVIGSKVVKGFEAYRNIAARIPLFWLLYPILFIGAVQTMGNNIYRTIADHRACKIIPKQMPQASPEPSNTILIATAVILISANVFFGFIGKGSGWPFACYPTFSEIAGNTFTDIDCQVIYPDGTDKTVHVQSLKSMTGSYRIAGLMNKIFNIKNEQKRNEKFLALWQVLASLNPDLHNAVVVRFYFIENYTDPAKWPLNPVSKKLAFEFKIDQH